MEGWESNLEGISGIVEGWEWAEGECEAPVGERMGLGPPRPDPELGPPGWKGCSTWGGV